MERLILITGSSRGIGASIATEMNLEFKSGTQFILLARDLSKLNEIKEKILSQSNGLNKVTLIQIDFSQENDYLNELKLNLPGEEELKNFKEMIVVYNHGTLVYGDLNQVAEENLRNKFEINLFSIWAILNAINKLIPTSLIKRQYHVNTSSGYAVEAAAKWTGHCCARASRDMLFKCLALEQPDLRVLNYEPGIVYTDMLKQATEITPEFQDGYDNGKYLRPEETARKLINLLIADKFQSGSRLSVHSNE